MKENCAECKHHDVFWGGSGCNLLNNGERCKFETKVMTNTDRIRAMSDEELAMQIVKNIPMHAWPDIVRKIYFNYDRPSKENPKKAWLEWLQQPAEGE